ncbi:transforming acidic coiled-coil-containing protein 3-like [Heptranchias perlo]|uniref:transforming acidic coiled-coil-containing protein 3-like n=1 Tax=Heptranchias perlo TaxID=212740 RepID=UPI0035593F51
MSLHLDENTFLDLQGSTIMDEQCDPLTLTETTGRPSILRVSQKENFPPKSSVKLPKVSFQTPLRDPVSRKVLSPHMTNKWDGNIAFDESGKNEEKVRNTGGPGSLNETEEKGNKNSRGTSEILVSNLGPEMLLKPEANQTTTANDVGLGDEEQISPKGTYALDFDMLDAINPFQGMSKVLNSPAMNVGDTELDCQEQYAKISSVSDQTLPKKTEQMLKATPCSNNEDHGKNASADIFSQVESQSNNVEQDFKVIISQITTCNFGEDSLEKIDPCASQTKVQISQLSPKDSYNFDFDHMDVINPFQMGGPKLQNSPPPGQDPLFQSKKKDVDADPVQPVRLEIEFNDGSVGEKKPPPKKLGKRPGGQLLLKKPGVTTEKTICSKSEKQNKEAVMLHDKTDFNDLLVPKMEYSVEWDKLDDPNFNPFGGGSKIGNSPSSAKLPAANSDGLYSLQDAVENIEPIAKEVDEVQKPASFARSDGIGGVPPEALKQSVKKNTCKVKPMMDVSAVAVLQDPVLSSAAGNVTETRLASSFERTITDHNRVQSTVSDTETPGVNIDFTMRGTSAFLNAIIEGEAEEFRPADQISTFNQPIEIDYLAQFGTSSFHSSALRKQSLYLKFDPLLRESPVKLAVKPKDTKLVLANPTTNSSRVVDHENNEFETRLITLPESGKQSNELDLFEMVDVATLIPDDQSTLIDPVADFRSATVAAEDAIVEVLKYSQKDMDAAILAVKQEVTNQENVTLKWKQKHEESLAECAEMKKIVAEYAEMTFQMIEESGKKSDLAKTQLEGVTEEKLQALKELNSVEKSFSELFKRFEKQKEALEGYKKNEESLKKCAQDYIARIKKEEQRYQALKVHAEEKLNQANEEIAQVRNKYKAEVAALQAHLRKEQMKTNSLERSLEEKTKENVELSKICDELISKMEKI